MTNADIEIIVKAQTDQATKEIAQLTKQLDKLAKQTKGMASANKKAAVAADSTTRSFKSLAIHVGKLMAIYASATGVISMTNKLGEMESALIDVEKTTGLTGASLVTFDKELRTPVFADFISLDR